MIEVIKLYTVRCVQAPIPPTLLTRWQLKLWICIKSWSHLTGLLKSFHDIAMA